MITPGQVKGKERVEEFDDEAFERAFEQAREDLLTETERDAAMATEEDVGLEEKTTDSEAVQATISSSTMDTLPEGDLREDGIQEEPRTLPDDEDDALAATAQELLDKVQHHQSDKFRHSNFLSLMRRLADREVRVLGDKVVEVDNVSSIRTSTAPPIVLSVKSAGSPHDSSYASGASTPAVGGGMADGYHFDTHICCPVFGCQVDHRWDSWESSPVH